jgi:hypothetical protein
MCRSTDMFACHNVSFAASTLEANGLSRMYTAADAEYATIQTSIPAISAFFTSAKEQGSYATPPAAKGGDVLQLRLVAESKMTPALEQLDAIEKTVAELEAVAAVLNSQSSRLEAAIKDALI